MRGNIQGVPFHDSTMQRKMPRSGMETRPSWLLPSTASWIALDALVYLILGLVGEGISPQEVQYV